MKDIQLYISKLPKEVERVALTAFFAIAEKWQLTDKQSIVLLGQPSQATFYRWKKNHKGDFRKDTIERISYLMGIYKALHILLPNHEAANQWIHKTNTAPLFAGKSALEIMLNGNVVDLADIRRYLDAERGW